MRNFLCIIPCYQGIGWRAVCSGLYPPAASPRVARGQRICGNWTAGPRADCLDGLEVPSRAGSVVAAPIGGLTDITCPRSADFGRRLLLPQTLLRSLKCTAYLVYDCSVWLIARVDYHPIFQYSTRLNRKVKHNFAICPGYASFRFRHAVANA
jgi:hypothetical protein